MKKAGPAPASGAAFGFDVQPAWQRGDRQIEADAIAMWARNGLLPPDVDPVSRAKELVAAAYKDDALAAVSTATIARVDALRARFAIIRGATDSAFRRSHAQLALAKPSRAALQAWAKAHPAERLAGGVVFLERGEWGDFARLPVWPESELGLIGYDDLGRQVRAAWFDHFRYDSEEIHPPVATLAPELPAGLAIRPAWRRGHAALEADAVAFWNRLGILPRGIRAEERAKELVAVAYRGDAIVGVITAQLVVLDQVRARLAMIRAAVDTDLRRTHLAFALMLDARAMLEQWSRANPDERLAGLGAVIEAPELRAREVQPFWPLSRFGVIGYAPNGRQIRVSWFEDFRLD